MRNHLLTVIARPTLNCNATCDYCNAAICSQRRWNIDDFKNIIDQLCQSRIYQQRLVSWIWHGGEPMLLKPDFYLEAYHYVKTRGYPVKFSMQSNLLLYAPRWHEVIKTVLGGAIGTSYDFGGTRNIHGNAAIYTKVFMKKLRQLYADGFVTGIVSVLTNDNISEALHLYELSRTFEKEYGQGFDLKYNYVYQEGRAKEKGIHGLDKISYKNFLLDLVDTLQADQPGFSVNPIDHFVHNLKQTGLAGCPFKNNCSAGMLSIDEDGHVYTCSSFANTQSRTYQYGNIFKNKMYCANHQIQDTQQHNFFDLLSCSAAYQAMQKRKINLHSDCVRCPHFKECQGGCDYQTVLEQDNLYGKPEYCEVWFALISKIKAVSYGAYTA